MAQYRRVRGLAFGFAAACSVLGATAYAASIAGSSHDLTALSPKITHQGSYYNNYNDICIYCHTVQTGTNAFDVWNRPLSTAVYTLYRSPTFNANMSAPDASSSSSLCLSCHDGTIAVDTINSPYPANTVTSAIHARMATSGPGACGSCHNELAITQKAADKRHGFLGTDLSNDHPINMTYDNLADPNLRPISWVTAAGLKLDSLNRVQCASCHDPHVPNEKAFLRISNVQSALCTTCHSK